MINHYILQNKLNRYGINGIFLNLFKSFISEGKHQARINSKVSSAYTINTGLLQGSYSLLYYFLFMIMMYLNYRELCLQFSLLMIHFFFENLITSANNEWFKHRDWTVANRLALKCKQNSCHDIHNKTTTLSTSIFFYHKQSLNVKEDCNFLGVTSDNKIKFSKHSQTINKKIGRSMGKFINLKTFTRSIF